MQPGKRTIKARISARKRRAGNVELEYFLDRRTDWPIMSTILKEEYNDLRSRLSGLPVTILVFELDPLLFAPREVGTVKDVAYIIDQAVRIDGEDKYKEGAMCCNGVNGEIVMVTPFTKHIYIIAPNGTIVREFLMKLNNDELIKRASCVDVYRNGRIVVADAIDGRIAVFLPDGTHHQTLLEPSSSRIEYNDQTFTIDKDDNLYVCNSPSWNVQKFDATGALVQTINMRGMARMPQICKGRLYYLGMFSMWEYDLDTCKTVAQYPVDSADWMSYTFDGAGQCIMLNRSLGSTDVYKGTEQKRTTVFATDRQLISLKWDKITRIGAHCRNMCIDPDGNIWVTPRGWTYQMHKYRPTN